MITIAFSFVTNLELVVTQISIKKFRYMKMMAESEMEIFGIA
jgi:hypothetical protein